MPCFSPLQAFTRPKLGGGCYISFSHHPAAKSISLPCGRCIGCRVERARQWAVRLVHEAELHDCSSFLTMTYNEASLPPHASLVKSHCQLFLKRLRARLDPLKVRFFLCGEYGELKFRPHYHMILFGFDFPDKVPLEQSSEYSLYRSDLLDSLWGFGDCRIGAVSFDSACYVANYACKKITGPKASSHYGSRIPEFLLMSRRPGIASGWIKKFSSDVFPSDEVIVKGHPSRPPRYYDQVFESDSPELMSTIRAKREVIASKTDAYVWNPRRNRFDDRLSVRRTVALAKLALKSRKLESQ